MLIIAFSLGEPLFKGPSIVHASMEQHLIKKVSALLNRNRQIIGSDIHPFPNYRIIVCQ